MMKPGAPIAARDEGFSLLEVLVAFVVLSLVATALFRLFGGALGNAAAADEWSRATLIAETRLTMAANVEPLREGSDQGNESNGRVRWETKVAPYDPPNTSDDIARASETMPTRLYRVTVDVHFPSDNGGERTVSLATLRLAQRNPP
jgi:general secretion pathway protein I